MVNDMAILKEAKKEKEQRDNQKKEKKVSIPLDEINKRFNSPYLIDFIHKELDKDHLEDHHAKMTTFLVSTTSRLGIDSEHQSIDVKGDSSAGKNSVVESTLKHFPENNWIKITRGTVSALEDDIVQYDIIFINEVNEFRENGANNQIIEVIKQLSEGGTRTIKKDAKTGFKTTIDTQQPQKTVITTTTELAQDEERATRSIEVSILNNPNTTAEVNKLSMERAADVKYLLGVVHKKQSWIQAGLSILKYNKVLLPFMRHLKDMAIFDNNNPRSKRDVKRLIALTKAVSYLYQNQRYKIKIKDDVIILGEPEDLYNAILIAGGFLNQSYKGYDHRLDIYTEKIEELSREPREVKKSDGSTTTIYAAPRHEIEHALGVARNTVKSKLHSLREYGLVTCTQYGNVWYYQRCQKGCQSQFLGVKIEDIKKHLKDYKVSEIDTLVSPIDTFNYTIIKKDSDEKAALWGSKVSISPEHTETLLNLGVSEENIAASKQKVDFDTFSLTPSELIAFIEEKGEYPLDEFAEKYGDEVIEKLKSKGDVIEMPKGILRVLK